MLRIGLARMGRSKKPLYRLVVSEKTKDMYGDNLEVLGNYNPHTKQAVFKVDRIKHWVSKGAQTSTVVHNLLVREKIISGAKIRAVTVTKRRKSKMEAAKKEEAKKAAPVEAPSTAPETPATETV